MTSRCSACICGPFGSNATRLPSTQLSDTTLLAAPASDGSSTLWKPSTVRKPGMPSVSGLPDARTNSGSAGRTQRVARPPWRQALRRRGGTDARIDPLRQRHRGDPRARCDDQLAIELHLRQRLGQQRIEVLAAANRAAAHSRDRDTRSASPASSIRAPARRRADRHCRASDRRASPRRESRGGPDCRAIASPAATSAAAAAPIPARGGRQSRAEAASLSRCDSPAGSHDGSSPPCGSARAWSSSGASRARSSSATGSSGRLRAVCS